MTTCMNAGFSLMDFVFFWEGRENIHERNITNETHQVKVICSFKFNLLPTKAAKTKHLRTPPKN